jgi:clan AA aspartic protease
MPRMGQFRVPVRLMGPTGRSEEVALLADTGAIFVTLPREIAERLELAVLRQQRVRVAGGAIATWPLTEVRVAIGDRDAPTLCLIAPSGPPLLGAVALESLLLAVDPVNQRLIPIEAYA